MKRRGRPPYPDVLTPREWEVLEFLRQGLSNEQIAERLGITLRTAKFHVSEILSKLAVETREQAAAWQPGERAPARRWLAWPLVARIAGALVIVAAVVGLGLLTWGVLRTSGDSDRLSLGDVNVEPSEAVGRALSAMNALEAFRAEVVSKSADEALPITIDRTRPLEYRVAFGSGDVSPIMITSGDKLYIRDCPDDTCKWTQADRPQVVSSFVVSGVLEPESIPLVSMEVGTGWQAVAVEYQDGEPLLHLHGQVNQLKAQYVSQQRAYAHAGVTDFGNSCDNISPPPRPETCHTRTFDEVFWNGSQPVDIDSAPLYPIDAWLHLNSRLVKRVTITPPFDVTPAPDASQFVELTTTYSRFDDISFGPPANYVAETPTPNP